jgi:hypothetical protein
MTEVFAISSGSTGFQDCMHSQGGNDTEVWRCRVLITRPTHSLDGLYSGSQTHLVATQGLHRGMPNSGTLSVHLNWPGVFHSRNLPLSLSVDPH